MSQPSKAAIEAADILIKAVGDYSGIIGHTFIMETVQRAIDAHDAEYVEMTALVNKLNRLCPKRPNAVTWEDGVEIITCVQDELLPALTRFNAAKGKK